MLVSQATICGQLPEALAAHLALGRKVASALVNAAVPSAVAAPGIVRSESGGPPVAGLQDLLAATTPGAAPPGFPTSCLRNSPHALLECAPDLK